MINKIIKFIRVHGRIIPIKSALKADEAIKKTVSSLASKSKETSKNLSDMMGAPSFGPNKGKARKLFEKRFSDSVSMQENYKKRIEKLKNIKNKAIKKSIAGSTITGVAGYLAIKKIKEKK